MRSGRYILACWLSLACGLGCSVTPKPAVNASPANPAGAIQPPPPNSTLNAPPSPSQPGGNADAGQASAQQAVAAALAANMNSGTNGPAGPPPTAAPARGANEPVPAATNVATAGAAGSSNTADAKALLDTLSELQASGAIDPETQQRMIEDLRQIDPALWPQLLQYYRSSMALRKKSERAAAKEGASFAATNVEVEMPQSAAPASEGSREPLAAAPAAVAAAPAETAAPAAAASAPELLAADPAATELVAQTAPRKAQPRSAATDKGSAAEKQAGPIKLVTATVPAASDAAAAPAKAADQDDANSWEEHLQAAVAKLEGMTSEPAQSAGEASRHAALRLLYLVCGRREDALTPIRGIPPGQQDFWSQELYGLSNYLDTERNPDSSRRAAEAVDRLREAAARLGEQATLAVKNLTFCTEVTSYGVYKPFGKDEFKAGQEVLLYAEVENFKSKQTDKGYQTALKSSYQILDPHGARVESQDFEVTEEHCHNVRRDFFMRYHIWMPKRIYSGRYTLQLTIEDTYSQKLGQSSLEFTIKE